MIAVVLISVSAGVIGTYIVTRRMVSACGGITHASFGGLGLGCYLGMPPMLFAGVFAVLSALGVEWMSDRQRLREDSAIAVVWAVGMAIGVLMVFLTPGYVPELTAFLFGNILTVNTVDLWIFGLYTSLLLGYFAWRGRWIVSCAFDRDFARVSGLPVRRISLVMTVMVALCIVLAIRLVGIMLLMSMISLPQITAEKFSGSFRSMAILSAVISLGCSLGGLWLATVIDVPCSALIVLVMAALFLLSRIVSVEISIKTRKTTKQTR